MKLLSLYTVLTVFAFIISCIDLIESTKPSNTTHNDGVIAANNEFTFKIFNILAKTDNDIISPFSILSAFSILMGGTAGDTLTDLKHFLNYGNNLDDKAINTGFEILNTKYQAKNESQKYFENHHTLNVANRVINDKSLQLMDEFANTVRKYYSADIQTADFKLNAPEETRKANEWVAKHTNNKIMNIFDKLDPQTTLVIINAIYFKGSWIKEFNKYRTMKQEFFNQGQNSAQVDTMTITHHYPYTESDDLGAILLDIPYKDNEMSFTIVLPKDRSSGLEALKQTINSQTLDTALKSLKTKYIQLFLPKFKCKKSYDLMKDITPKPIALTNRADISRITQSVREVVSQVVHKTFVSVDEDGTEAAAVTAMKGVPYSAWRVRDKPTMVKVDHPFLYFIRDKTNGLILFYGQINQL